MTKKDTPRSATCSFCGRPEEDVEKLISGPSSFICDKCVKLCTEILSKKPAHHELKLLKPKEIKKAIANQMQKKSKSKQGKLSIFYLQYI